MRKARSGSLAARELNDHYYELIPEERYGAYAPPKTFTIGQLTDDWAESRRVLDGAHEPVNYNLVWLAAGLRRVGEICVG